MATKRLFHISFILLLHEDTLFTLLQGGFEPGIEATLSVSRVSRRPYEHLGGPRYWHPGGLDLTGHLGGQRHISASIQAAL